MYHPSLSTGGRVLGAACMLALLALTAPAAAGAAPGVTITVTSGTDDFPPITNGNCTLREAIIASNTNTIVDTCPAGTAGLDTIAFSVSDVALVTDLPDIVRPVIVDGTVGGVPGLLIHNADVVYNKGFVFNTGSKGSFVRGVKMTDFGRGILLTGASGGVTVTNSWFGTADGVTPSATSSVGIAVESPGNHIGLPGQPRNMFASVSTGIMVDNLTTGTVIQNNWFGLATDGVTRLGVDVGIYVYGSNTLIGGSSPGQGNVISGANMVGIEVYPGAANTRIIHNMIGTTADGMAAARNIVGIEDLGAQKTIIGGPMLTAGNLISGNAIVGIHVTDTGRTSQSLVTITGNLIGVNLDGVPLPTTDGIRLTMATAPTPVKLAGNLITGATGHALYTDGVAGGLLLKGSTMNCIAGNAVGFGGYGAPSISFPQNWWGSPQGPNGAGGNPLTDSRLGIDPFLTVKPASCYGWAPPSYTPGDLGVSANTSRPMRFSWGAVRGASSYTAVLGHDSGPANIFDGGSGPATSFTTSAPLPYGRYFWSVTTHAPGGIDWVGPQQMFYVTIQKTPPPEIISSSQVIRFSWARISGATYLLGLYYDDTCTTPDNTDNQNFVPQTTTSLTPLPLPLGNYYWTLHVTSPSFTGDMPCLHFTVLP